MQVVGDLRQRGGDDRLVERRQQRREHDRAEGDQDLALRASFGGHRTTTVAGAASGSLIVALRRPMRLIVARCSVEYSGRLSAHLPEALRLIMLKADGSVLVHADAGGYKPLNWMTPPTAVIEDGRRRSSCASSRARISSRSRCTR